MADLQTELQAIYDRHGSLTPKLVVDEAQDENHPLHSHFTWDDTVAAEKWRHTEARNLIRKVRVVEHTAAGPAEVRGFYSVRRGDVRSYEPLAKVQNDDFAMRLILNDMEREWVTLRRKYSEFSDFWKLIRDEVEKAS